MPAAVYRDLTINQWEYLNYFVPVTATAVVFAAEFVLIDEAQEVVGAPAAGTAADCCRRTVNSTAERRETALPDFCNQILKHSNQVSDIFAAEVLDTKIKRFELKDE